MISKQDVALFQDSPGLRAQLCQGLDGSPECLHSVAWAVMLDVNEVEMDRADRSLK